jgi:ATP-dependent Clp endopeptidase proteolytic subunit ClpP
MTKKSTKKKVAKKTTRKPSAATLQTEADLARTQAETRKVQAEANIAEFLARKTEAEAEEAEIKVYEAKIELAAREACDERNQLYRFSKDVSYSSVRSCMSILTGWHRRNDKCDMEIIFSSPGGSIIDGFELFDFIQDLRGKGHKITTGSLGMAASMAGILLQAGDVRWIGHQSWMMIHRAAFGAIGKTYEVEDEVRLVKRIEERIVDIITSRSKLTNQKIKRNWDRKDWWIDADECFKMGLVDEVRAVMPEHHVGSKKNKGNKK